MEPFDRVRIKFSVEYLKPFNYIQNRIIVITLQYLEPFNCKQS